MPRLTRACILAVAVFVAVAAAAEAAPAADGGCKTAMDCNLNGECMEGACACHAPWSGPTCGTFRTIPIPTTPVGYGMKPNLTSWGGQIVEVDGKYHMFMAEMIEGCGLRWWHNNSACVHAVADTPEGPYTRVGVAVPVWCHNPQVVKYQKPNGGGVGFALFHIGHGAGEYTPKNCSANATLTAEGITDEMAITMGLGEGGRGRAVVPGTGDGVGLAASAGGRLHLADSVDGPWTPYTTSPDCNNPAPFQHPNGTWYLLCNSHNIYRAPTVTGPWTAIASVYVSGGVVGTYEDPFLWMDAQERWHVLFHTYNSTFPCGACNSTLVSGHRYSPDGIHWEGSDVSPYHAIIERTDGSHWRVATRERPKLFLRDGVPEYLLTGTCGGCATCPPGESVNCKYLHWDFTLVQQLDTSAGD